MALQILQGSQNHEMLFVMLNGINSHWWTDRKNKALEKKYLYAKWMATCQFINKIRPNNLKSQKRKLGWINEWYETGLS